VNVTTSPPERQTQETKKGEVPPDRGKTERSTHKGIFPFPCRNKKKKRKKGLFLGRREITRERLFMKERKRKEELLACDDSIKGSCVRAFQGKKGEHTPAARGGRTRAQRKRKKSEYRGRERRPSGRESFVKRGGSRGGFVICQTKKNRLGRRSGAPAERKKKRCSTPSREGRGRERPPVRDRGRPRRRIENAFTRRQEKKGKSVGGGGVRALPPEGPTRCWIRREGGLEEKPSAKENLLSSSNTGKKGGRRSRRNFRKKKGYGPASGGGKRKKGRDAGGGEPSPAPRKKRPLPPRERAERNELVRGVG